MDALLGEGVEATPEKKKEGAYLLVQLGGETQRAEVCASRYSLLLSLLTLLVQNKY